MSEPTTSGSANGSASSATPATRSRRSTPSWRERFPGRTLWEAMLYDRSRALVGLAYRLAFGLRVDGMENIPRTGAVLALANHQSHLDPPLMGVVAGNRGMAAVARESLLNNPFFGWWVRTYKAIPIRRGAGDTAAIRTILDVLKTGEYVAMFPEGTRSADGLMRPLERGVTLLLRKSECLVVPVGIEGTGLAWPRSRALPRLWGSPRIHACVGRGIPSSELLAMRPDEALRFIASEIDGLRLTARQRLRERTRGAYPPPGPADAPSAFDANRAHTSGAGGAAEQCGPASPAQQDTGAESANNHA
jgi:1-acyl-sn-glycerol-3-phosphate acyltransferase